MTAPPGRLLVLLAPLLLRPVLAAIGPSCVCDPPSVHNCSLPGLQHLRPGLYEGIIANYLSYATETSSPQFKVRAQEFKRCTGGEIRFADASDVFTDPIQDLGTRAAEGQNMFDGYFMSYSHFPEASALGLAETLNERIRQSMEQLRWEDVYPKVKIMGQYRRDGRNDLDFLMFDGDFFVPLVRLDLLEKYQKPLPNTWQEVVDLAHFFHGKDLNEDGEPDYGLCHFPRAGAGFWDEWWPEMVYAIWATMAQTGGHSEGFFFDATTFTPKLESTSFREAAKIWRELRNVTEEGCTSDNMIVGRCALGFSPPGCWKGVFLNGMARKDASGNILWQPTLANGRYAEPYRLQPFGSLKVEDPSSGQLEHCSSKRCPYAEPISANGHVSANDRASFLPPSPLVGQLINRAPFFWSGGLGTLIRKSAAPVVKDLLWDYFVYLNSPVTSVTDVATYSSWIDSWRHTQLTAEGENFVVLSTWSPEAYAEHRSVMQKSLGQSSNAALNLRIPGIKEYTFGHLAAGMVQFESQQITIDELVSRVKEGWEEITNSHGLLEQLETYRAALGKEPLPTSELCRLHRHDMDRREPNLCSEEEARTYQIVLVVLGGVAGACLLVGFAMWVFRTAWAKRRLLAEQQQRMQDLVKQALDTVGTLKYPMVLVPASSFLSMGKLISNEALRDRADVKLKFLDSCWDIDAFLDEMKIVFLSHQWLAYSSPDPQKIQYLCSCASIRKLVHDRSWNISKTYIWCDFCSVPQRCSATQTLAVASLPVYASKVSAFIIVAPTAVHQGWDKVASQGSFFSDIAWTTDRAGTECSLETYKRRAWCRAEVLSHALSKGVSAMYVATETGLTPLVDNDALIDEAIYVFEGDLTCCRMKHENLAMCDRQRLVVPFLGLYSYVIHALKWKSGTMDQATLEFFTKIIAQKERVFPSSFRFVTSHRVEKARPLFRGLLSIMEDEVKNTLQPQFEEFRVAKHSSNTSMVRSPRSSDGASRLEVHVSSSTTMDSCKE